MAAIGRAWTNATSFSSAVLTLATSIGTTSSFRTSACISFIVGQPEQRAHQPAWAARAQPSAGLVAPAALARVVLVGRRPDLPADRLLHRLLAHVPQRAVIGARREPPERD